MSQVLSTTRMAGRLLVVLLVLVLVCQPRVITPIFNWVGALGSHLLIHTILKFEPGDHQTTTPIAPRR